MSKDAQNDLSQYLNALNSELEQDYKQIQNRVKEDPGTAGDQVEETWAGILRKWLPSHYHVVTKGRILSSTGEASPQIDILVLWPSYPPFLLGKKLYMASGVAAAFECKLTLRKEHLRKLFQTAIALSKITEKEHSDRKYRFKEQGKNYAYQEIHRIFEYGLLAHSFNCEDLEKGSKIISEEINILDRELITHPNQMVDLICIHNIGSWASERQAIFIDVKSDGKIIDFQFHKNPYTIYKCLTQKSWADGSNIQINFSPLGSFLARFYRKLSRVDDSLLPLSDFFTKTLSTGQGGGKNGRVWNEIQIPEDLWKMSEPLRKQKQYFMPGFTFLGF